MHDVRLNCLTACALAFLLLANPCCSFANDTRSELRHSIETRVKQLEAKLIERRHDLHAHPELGNQEQRTAGVIAKHLRDLGLEVRTGVARTGVVGILKGGLPGKVVGLRADMDALPVKEATSLAFASTAKGKFRGNEVDVMHACGHDGHMAILMTAAEVLAGMRAKLPGTIVFYFQPAEEGPSDFVPDGTNSWGAKLMVEEGALRAPKPAALFALHLWAGLEAGHIAYRAGPTMASSDDLRIRVIGKQTHAGRPWAGVDPIVASSHVILGLQTIISRETDLSSVPTVLSIGTIHGGSRYNIIPDSVEMEGTIRAYDPILRDSTHEKVKRSVEHHALAAGARAEVTILKKYDVTVNDAALTARAVPTLQWAANGKVEPSGLVTGAEDFSFMAREAPGFFFFLGASKPGRDLEQAAPNHSPNFTVEDGTLAVGVRALAALATDYLTAK